MSGNQSVSRALAILEYLADVMDPQDLGTISGALGLNKSTVHRFLSTLKDSGYVHQDADSGRYSLGSRVAWLGSKFLDGVEVRTVARPTLEQLAAATGETIHFGILHDSEVAYIDKVDGRGAVRMASRIGARMPLHCTALGKVLLSSLPRESWKGYINDHGLPQRTDRTITDPLAFANELDAVSSQGYAVDNGENEEGIRCIAAPIVDHTGRTIAALSVTGWTVTMSEERIRQIIPQVVRAGAEISNRMGYGQSEGPQRATG